MILRTAPTEWTDPNGMLVKHLSVFQLSKKLIKHKLQFTLPFSVDLSLCRLYEGRLHVWQYILDADEVGSLQIDKNFIFIFFIIPAPVLMIMG